MWKKHFEKTERNLNFVKLKEIAEEITNFKQKERK